MKRPPQQWVVSFGILCLCLLPSVLSLRATSLIFSKTSSTTSTTSTTEAPSSADEETSTSSVNESGADGNQTATKPTLTGIPQIDYIWDPNLPFELRGYNLSDYPFYDRVPDEIDFKCDGLHDGFYASVPHKCQVYHHCLFGTRYDFLCANFTAFDQKTFICHFVSEVDCNNSKKFWHRNDALYKAATTTTTSTTTIQPITPSPALNPALRRPAPGIRRRRPFRRRRPQYDYYYDEIDDYDDRERDRARDRDRDRDDYYDDPPPRSSGSRRRKRPRPNRRPEYEEYDEYEDERYDRRTSGRRDEDRDRRPYRDDDRRYDDRRSSNKNKDRRVEDDEDDRKLDDRRKTDDRRRPSDDRRIDDDYDRRSYDRPRKPSRDRYENDKIDDRRPFDRRKVEEDKNDRRTYDRPRKQDEDDRRYRPKDQKTEEKDDRRSYDRPRKSSDEERRYRPRDKSEERTRPTEETKLLIKPNSGSSVYDRPRAPPIIRRPVPKNERDKYDYKTTAAAKPSPKPEQEDEEYYDDYEEESKLPPPKPTRKTNTDSRESEERRSSYSRPRRPQPQVSSRRPIDESEEDRRSMPKRNQDRLQERPQERSQERGRFDSDRNNKKSSVEEEYADEYEEDKLSLKGESSRERERSSEKPKLIPATSSEENVNKERERRPDPVIKIVKRPFLPSRGGNPYAARGLQPVGAKALDATTEINKPIELTTQKPKEQTIQEEIKSSKLESEEEMYYDEEEDLKPITKRPQTDIRPFRNDQSRTTQKPKVSDNYRNPLDINENEYDVTLNDALNPTLPNLPVRSVPTGFSSGRDGYLSQTFPRSRLVAVETPVLAPTNSEYVYVKQPTARYNPYIAVQLNRQPYTTYQ